MSDSTQSTNFSSNTQEPISGTTLAREYEKLTERIHFLSADGVSLDRDLLYSYENRISAAKEIASDEAAQFAIIENRPDLRSQLAADMEAFAIREELSDLEAYKKMDETFYGDTDPQSLSAEDKLTTIMERFRKSARDPNSAGEAASTHAYYRGVADDIMADPATMAGLAARNPASAQGVLTVRYPENQMNEADFRRNHYDAATMWMDLAERSSEAAAADDFTTLPKLQNERIANLHHMQADPAIAFEFGRILGEMPDQEENRALGLLGMLGSDSDLAHYYQNNYNVHSLQARWPEAYDAAQTMAGTGPDAGLKRYVYLTNAAHQSERALILGEGDPAMIAAYRLEAQSQLRELIEQRGPRASSLALEIGEVAIQQGIPIQRIKGLYSADKEALSSTQEVGHYVIDNGQTRVDVQLNENGQWVANRAQGQDRLSRIINESPIPGLHPSLVDDLGSFAPSSKRAEPEIKASSNPDPQAGRIKIDDKYGAIFQARAFEDHEGFVGGILNKYVPSSSGQIEKIITNKNTPAFLLPLSPTAHNDNNGNFRRSSEAQFGQAMGYQVQRSVRALLKEPDGLVRLDALMQGTLNARNAIAKTPVKSGSQDAWNVWQDKTELGFRALLEATKKEAPDLYNKWRGETTSFVSMDAKKLELDNKPIYGVQFGQSKNPIHDTNGLNSPDTFVNKVRRARAKFGLVERFIHQAFEHGGAT